MYVDIKGQLIFFLNLSPTVSLFFCQLSLFQKNSNEMFSMFFEGKKHRIESFIGIFLKVMI